MRLVLPVAHRLTGSLILGGTVILALRTLAASPRRIVRIGGGETPPPIPPHIGAAEWTAEAPPNR
jgi:hypothetical protein